MDSKIIYFAAGVAVGYFVLGSVISMVLGMMGGGK